MSARARLGTTVRPSPLVVRETALRIELCPAVDVATRILEARFGGRPLAARLPASLKAFQRDAVARARLLLARRGGVLIADSVGLGKTHIALALVEPFLDAGHHVTVVGPAALERHWRSAAAAMPAFEWISYSRLSRGLWQAGERQAVVFDEAHALRNPRTRRYRAAAGLCRTSRVVLLSATPVNNGVWDLYHLIRLFSGDRDYLDAGVASLRSAFEEAEKSALLGAAPSVQPVLRSIMIRRTRPLLRDLARASGAEDAGLVFPTQRPPRAVRYSLVAHAGPEPLADIGRLLPELSFPPYRLAAYADAPRPAHRDSFGMAALMRIALLKRLESSAIAFHRSIAAYRALLSRCVDGLARGLMIRPDIALVSGGHDLQLTFEALLFDALPPGLDAAGYRAELDGELECVDAMSRALAPALESDGKLEALTTLLARMAGRHRILLFTQFRHTAQYLHDRLRGRWRVGLIDGGGARLGSAVVHRSEVIRCFAPLANHAPAPPAHEAIDVLVATDVISEGFNLQDADVVISYDLPWNPVRLVQRIGRIDRLGSPHPTIASYHFLPGALEPYLGLLDRLSSKGSAIEATVGSDMPALHAELALALERRDSGIVERIERADAEWFELDERLLAALARAPACRSDSAADALPVGLLPWSGRAPPCGLVAALVGGRFEWVAVSEGRAVNDDRVCARMIEDVMSAHGHEHAPSGPRGAVLGSTPTDVIARLLDAARPSIARLAGVAASASLLPAGGEAERLGRLLLNRAASMPGGPDGATCKRIELCLERLASLPPELEARLPHLLPAATARTGTVGEILDRIDALPHASSARQIAQEGPAGATVRLVGALLEMPGQTVSGCPERAQRNR